MDVDVVSFRLPAHGDTALSNMNFLRTQQHFCDVTIVAGGRRMFRGHKVVLAACSVFLRDQFLMNPSSELQQVSMLHSSAVVCELLQSCYTGMLQFSAKEIVNYLTAASYLQMEHVVEKCRGALSQYMQPQTGSPVGNVSTSNKAIQTVNSEDCLSMPVIVSVRGSDASGHFEGEDGPESDIIQVQINDEHQAPEKTSGAEEEDREAVVVLDDHEPMDAGIEEPSMEGQAKGNDLRGAGRMWRRRHGEHRGGRGRGFKHRKRYIFKDRKLLGNYQDYQECLSTPDETTGNFGADFQADFKSNHQLTDGPVLVEYRAGEGQGEEIVSDGGPAHFGVEASSGEQGMRVGTHTNEHGAADESVGVVGSTSSVAGPVVCEQCGLAVCSMQDLAMHSLVSHRLYMCPCCGKHFNHFNILNRHMIVHRGVSKLHCCPLCHKTFTQKSTLLDHMNVHSGERPYVCAYCHVSFAHKSALRRHLMEQHGKTMPQNQIEMQRNNGLGF
ncbi:zinc finger and BTB domain-containing protein 12-like isoform X1 [Carassius gibelio]|uniref:zinc finger and BTB domain-containing protein 12-like isoform X1 n=1 Tax=Carassius gibelio TaxID=101364 RepID=UPI002279C135|nr:zinc finger and BTB domain-containing protein 12-like isoform X1 [Carassius gibelio]XP_052388344.1 zinc finger and BTB domain-containing protein 12-like isoform X1 [Carassius gibelio]XP_052388346.1 zinc finger and BTB domain-containing protein 12-like isoform X1 [Carassius gibelio]